MGKPEGRRPTSRPRHRYKKDIELDLKVKAIPLQAWIGPEVSRRLRLPDFQTVGT